MGIRRLICPATLRALSKAKKYSWGCAGSNATECPWGVATEYSWGALRATRPSSPGLLGPAFLTASQQNVVRFSVEAFQIFTQDKLKNRDNRSCRDQRCV